MILMRLKIDGFNSAVLITELALRISLKIKADLKNIQLLSTQRTSEPVLLGYSARRPYVPPRTFNAASRASNKRLCFYNVVAVIKILSFRGQVAH